MRGRTAARMIVAIMLYRKGCGALPSGTAVLVLDRCPDRVHTGGGCAGSRWRLAERTGVGKEQAMAESVYKVVELVGSSPESWERAAALAIETASQTLRDLRVARIVEQDIHIEDGRPLTYRVKMELSFKYERGDRL